MDVLLVPYGTAGDLHPFVALGLALRARGHRVRVLTPAAAAPAAERAGLEVVRVRRAAYRLADALVLDRLLARPVNAARAELGLPPVRRVLGAWRHSPQCVLGLFPEWFAPPQPDWPAATRLTGFPLYDGAGAAE